MNLAIFDLDNTLLNGDSDYLWGMFLVKKNLVDQAFYEERNQYFYDEYKAGRLNINEFLAFSLKPLADIEPARLVELHKEFMQTEIIPIITPQAKALVEKHRQAGDYLLIITATNLFVTEPIAQYFSMDHIIATEPEKINGKYTGNVKGIPSFQEGKVTRFETWLKEQQFNIRESYFYSDSFNDIPLLNQVNYPIAVDPDERLLAHAKENQWEVISLR